MKAEFLRIQRMDDPEIEDLEVEEGITSGFLINLRSVERLERKRKILEGEKFGLVG